MTDHQVALLEAWSTFAAAIFAAAAAVFAYRAYLKESRIETRLRDAAEREQASKVAAWIGEDPSGRYDGGEWLIIRNASEAPIYKVRCAFYIDDLEVAVSEQFAVVPPSAIGLRAFVPGEVYEATSAYEPRDVDVQDCPVGINFTDASGTEWDRGPDGQLIAGVKPSN